MNREGRTVSFGRDFLGHHPLSYACARGQLYVSDDVHRIGAVLATAGVELTLSEEALALYFAMGYVPHGHSVYREIVNCEATGYYTWSKGAVRRTRQFEPVQVDEAAPVEDLGEAIEREVKKCAGQAEEIDVWCSGGLDSSIMGVRFNAAGRRADLLTLGYGQEIHERLGDGERRFAQELARHCGARLREVELSCAKFEAVHATFVRNHNAPVMDTPLPPKYALAEASRGFVVTGEGGDCFFGGTKNNEMLYGYEKDPSVPLGWRYALAHHRYAAKLEEIFHRGEALTGYVGEYCERLLEAYPGPLQRKLFYVNSLVKPASMIFGQSYFPSVLHGLTVRHPLAALGVYRQAFRLPDQKKVVYPHSKIALKELYGAQLPELILRRRKSGTILPREFYIHGFPAEKLDFDALRSSGLFREEFLVQLSKRRAKTQSRLVYALVTLNMWLKQKGSAEGARSLPFRAGHHQPSHIGVGA